CRFPMLLDERVLPLVCYSTGAGECSRVACGPSRRMKTLSARAGCVNSSDECGNWSACSVARPWKSGFSRKRLMSRGEKTDIAAAVMERSEGRFAMKAVADTLAVARSNLVERVARPTKPHRAYRKAADEPLLVLIRRLVDERPTYGYRRITRLVNRQQK